MQRSLYLTWHIVRKDLRRLRWPLVLWLLLMVAKLAFFAVITGVFGAPNEAWLVRMHNVPELLLSLLLDLMVAYFLLGYLIFEDSLVEGEPFWITRPISGARLLAAKVSAVVLVFVGLPLLVNLSWWLACGFDAGQTAWAAGAMAAQYAVVLGISFCCATLTNGFPRFVLWSVAGLAGVIILWMAVAMFLGPKARQAQFVVLVPLEVALLLALVCHQFLTRRQRRTWLMLAGGTIAVALVGIFWPWNANNWAMRRLLGERVGSDKVTARIEGDSTYQLKFKRNGVITVPLGLSGIPAVSATYVRAQGQWNWQDGVTWKRDGGSARGFGPKRGDLSLHGDMTFAVSPVLAERMLREPPALHVDLNLQLYDLEVQAELPLRPASRDTSDGSLSLGEVSVVQVTAEMHRRLKLGVRTPIGCTVVRVKIVQRLGNLPAFIESLSRGWVHPPNAFYLRNRVTREEIMGDYSYGGFVFLNAVGVLNTTVFFKVDPTASALESYELKVVGFQNDRAVKSSLDVSAFQLRSAPEAKPPQS